MTVKFNRVDITGLRATHFEQLRDYVEHRERTNYYYGNREQYEKRHKELKVWLAQIIIKAKDTNNRIPKAKG